MKTIRRFLTLGFENELLTCDAIRKLTFARYPLMNFALSASQDISAKTRRNINVLT